MNRFYNILIGLTILSLSAHDINALQCYKCTQLKDVNAGIFGSQLNEFAKVIGYVISGKCYEDPSKTVECNGRCFYVEGKINALPGTTFKTGATVVVRGCDEDNTGISVKGIAQYFYDDVNSQISIFDKLTHGEMAGSYCGWDKCDTRKCDKGYFKISSICFSYWYIPALIAGGITFLFLVSCCCCCCCCCKPCKRRNINTCLITTPQTTDRIKLV